MHSLDAYARDKLAQLDGQALRRSLTATERLDGVRVRRDGRTLVSFSCNDYLGLSHHPQVKAAAIEAVARYGAGAGASRLVTGEHPLLHQLELRLARRKQADAALVFGSGYLANVGVPPALVGPKDLIVLDDLAHACMWAGARLSGAQVSSFRHNDVDHLQEVLSKRRADHPRALVLSERVFSMDGDLAPVGALLHAARGHDAWLMIDDAHGLGVVEAEPKAPLEMGTLSKALGSYGGYLCGPASVIELLKNRARSFVYTTGLPPASAAAAIAALDVLEAEPERRARPLQLARRFTAQLGLAEAASAIVPVIVGEAQAALDLSARLQDQGYLVVAIRPPTVPAGEARLRVAFSAAHSDADVDGLVQALAPALHRLPVRAA